MKTYCIEFKQKHSIMLLVLMLMFAGLQTINAVNPSYRMQDSLVNIYTGIVVSENGEKLPYAAISVENGNISTVTNSEGNFILKIPKEFIGKKIVFSFIGYESLRIPAGTLNPSGNKIHLKQLSVVLPPLEVITKDPRFVVEKMLENKNKNYSDKDMVMTAFYRETIRKRNTNVSLSEAIVEVFKNSYSGNLNDMAALYKSRKSTDYNRLDTLVFKLMGGPFNNIYVDVIKYPDIFFTDKMFENYQFNFVKTDRIDDRLIYIIDFKQYEKVEDPLFYGNLYIDSQTYALVRADFDLNLKNNEEATRIFVRKKPLNAKVSTTKAHYVIDYRLMDDNKWYYSYSKIDLNLKVNWKRRLFNTYYNSTIEMAATDWSDDIDRKAFRSKERINPSVIIHDAASGFSDPEFWGEYNVIEPDKSIENAINKIKKQLEKTR